MIMNMELCEEGDIITGPFDCGLCGKSRCDSNGVVIDQRLPNNREWGLLTVQIHCPICGPSLKQFNYTGDPLLKVTVTA